MSDSANSNANDVPGLEFTPRKPGDVIDDSLIAELARRLRFASSPSASGGGSLSLGFGATVSDDSGNQIQDKGGLYVSLGAGLGVAGAGLVVGTDNKIQLKGQRAYSQISQVSADSTLTFTLPEQMDSYIPVITPLSNPAQMACWVSKTSVAMTVVFDDVTVPFSVEIAAIEKL